MNLVSEPLKESRYKASRAVRRERQPVRGLYSIRQYLKLDATAKRQNVDRALDDLERLLMEKGPRPVSRHRVGVCLARLITLSCVVTGGTYLLIELLGVRP